jgi:hypothetical protein
MDEKKNYFIKFLTKYPELLKKATVLDNKTFSKLESDYLSKERSRDRYIYDASLRIQQVGFFYIRADDLVNSSNDADFDSDIGLNFAISLERELTFWIRSLHELFVYSFLFRTTSHDKYFRYYFLTKALEAFAKRAKNKKEFFGMDNLNENEKPIDNILNELALLESGNKILSSKVWFLKESKQKSKLISSFKREKLSDIGNSYRSLFKMVLPRLAPSQRIALGLDYGYYSELSEMIHNNIGGPKRVVNYTKEYFDAYLQALPLIAGHIILNLSKILKKKTPNQLKDLEKILIQGFDNSIYKFNKKKLSKSDYVLVNGLTLGRVLKVNNTKYGYQSVIVEHIDSIGWKPSEDVFSSDKTIWLFDQSKIEKDFRRILLENGKKVRISKNELNKLLDKNVNNLWHKLGAKEHFLGDREGALKKIQENLKNNIKV